MTSIPARLRILSMAMEAGSGNATLMGITQGPRFYILTLKVRPALQVTPNPGFRPKRSAIRGAEATTAIAGPSDPDTGNAMRHASLAADASVFYNSQFSTCRLGTRSNSLVLAVTRTALRDRACAAMSRSFGPMGLPAPSSPVRMSP